MTPDRVRTSRRAVLAATVATAALPLAACRAGEETPHGELRIATGNVGAVFERYGRALATQAERVMPEVETRTLTTAGSVDNVEAVSSGTADVGFCLGDTAALLRREGSSFTALARLYDSFLQVVVRDDGPRSVSELEGLRLTAGQVGSGTRLTLERTLSAAGVRPGRLVDASLAEAADALVGGEVDALAFVSGFPIPTLADLGRRVPLRAIDLAALVPTMVERWGAHYVPGPLPAAAYRLAAPVQTVSVKTYLVCRPDLDAAVARGFLGVVFEQQDAVADTVPDVRQPTAAAGMFTDPVPLHPASLEYFAEQDARGT